MTSNGLCRTWHVAWLVVGAGCGGGATQSSTQPVPDDRVEFEAPPEEARGPRAGPEVRQAESLMAQGDMDGAGRILEQVVAEHPDDARAQLDLGVVRETQGRAADAEAAYRAAIAADPRLPEAYNNLGVLLRDRERLAEGIEHLRRATELRPAYAEAHANLALALEDSGDASAAIDAYREAARLAPTDAVVRANLGLLLLAAEQKDDARRELAAALPHAEGNAAALSAIGNGLRRAGDPALAVTAMQEALEATAPTPALLSELALARLANEDSDGALEALRRALELDDDYATGHFLLGSVLAGRNERAEARRHLQRYLALEPRGQFAARAREKLGTLGR